MQVYDKVSWQVDGGIKKDDAINHFKVVFGWLSDKGLLSELGQELFESGVDGSFSLSDNDLTEEGIRFISQNYDDYISKIQYGIDEDTDLLEELYIASRH